jgi:hypothetical protein
VHAGLDELDGAADGLVRFEGGEGTLGFGQHDVGRDAGEQETAVGGQVVAADGAGHDAQRSHVVRGDRLRERRVTEVVVELTS